MLINFLTYIALGVCVAVFMRIMPDIDTFDRPEPIRLEKITGPSALLFAFIVVGWPGALLVWAFFMAAAALNSGAVTKMLRKLLVLPVRGINAIIKAIYG